MTNGWTFGLRAALPEAHVEVFAVGGSTCVQLSAHMARDFGSYDCVLIDSLPNDEQWVAAGGSLPYVRRIFFEIASTIRSKTRLIVLGIPQEQYLTPTSLVCEKRKLDTAAAEAQFVSVQDFVLRFGRRVLEPDERLYEDGPHPNRKLGALIGFQLGRSLGDFVAQEAKTSSATDYSHAFSETHVETLVAPGELVRKQNSRLAASFAALKVGDVVPLSGLGRCTGFYVDKSDTKCRATMTLASGEVRRLSLLFRDKPGAFALYFNTFDRNTALQEMLIEPKLEQEVCLPKDYQTLPDRALIERFAFWNGDANQTVPAPEDVGTGLRLQGTLFHMMEREVLNWFETLRHFRRGIDERFQNAPAAAKSSFRLGVASLPAPADLKERLSVILARQGFMPVPDAGPSKKPRAGRQNFQYGVQIAPSCGLTPGGMRAGDATSIRQRLAMVASLQQDWADVIVTLANFDATTVKPGPTPLNWQCAIEFPEGTYTPVRWGKDSQRTVTVEPGAVVRSSPVSISLPGGSRFWFVSQISCPDGGYWFMSRSILQPADGSGVEMPASFGSTFVDPVEPSYGFAGPVPAAITARAVNPKKRVSPPLSLAIWGDSILEGRDDLARRGENGHFGWPCRSAAALGLGYVQVSKAGAALQQQLLPDNIGKLDIINGCSIVLTNFGTNDVGQRRRTATQVIKDMTEFVEVLKAHGHRVIMCTILPRTDADNSGQYYGDDNEETIANLHDYNDWIRKDPFGMGLFDAAREAADPSDPRRWRSDLGQYSRDGLHPAAPIHKHLSLAFLRLAPSLGLDCSRSA